MILVFGVEVVVVTINLIVVIAVVDAFIFCSQCYNNRDRCFLATVVAITNCLKIK